MTRPTPSTSETRASADRQGDVNTPSGDYVVAAERTLAVLRSFDAANRHMTLTEVAKRSGLSRGTARRFLMTLETLGYLGSDGKHFSLTPRVLTFASAYLASFGIGDSAKSTLKRVADEVGEAASMAVLEGGNVVYVARADAPRKFATKLSLHIGSQMPAYCTSLGRVLLAAMSPAALDQWIARYPLTPFTDRTVTDPVKLRAALDEVRREGYAIVDGETEVGLRSMAVPVVARNGQTPAALNVATLTARTPATKLRRVFLPVLRRAAKEIAETLELR